MPTATKTAQNGVAATDAALTQVGESAAAAFPQTSTVAGNGNAALDCAVLPVPDAGSGPHPALLAALRSAVGHHGVVVDPSITTSYSRDMMPLAPSGSPLAVVFPADHRAGRRRGQGVRRGGGADRAARRRIRTDRCGQRR